MTAEELEQFEDYLDSLPEKQRDAVENLQIFLEENFSDEQLENIKFGVDRDEDEWYIWVCELNGQRFNLVFDYDTEEVNQVIIH